MSGKNKKSTQKPQLLRVSETDQNDQSINHEIDNTLHLVTDSNEVTETHEANAVTLHTSSDGSGSEENSPHSTKRKISDKAKIFLSFNNLEVVKTNDNEDSINTTNDNSTIISESDDLLVSNLSLSGNTVKMKKLLFFVICFIIGIFNLLCFCIQYYYVYTYIFSKDFKTMKLFCFGQTAGENDLCFISIGQFAYGIITIGQITVGIVNISQIGIGLLFGLGQISLGFIFNIGQIAVSSYVFQAQLGLALWKVRKAQVGANCIDAALNNKSFIILGCKEAIENN